MLTRTTLQIDDAGAGASLAHMVRALQRVPGVLLAEVNATNARAVVAHDAAVPATSLIAAAQNAGVRVRILSDLRAPMVGGGGAATRAYWPQSRKLLIAAAVSFAIVIIVSSLVPNAAGKHEILIVMTVSIWAYFLAKSFVAHR